MSEKRFVVVKGCDNNVEKEGYFIQDTHYGVLRFGSFWKEKFAKEDCKILNDLCGQSDSENAKLRQEIKELKAQLREKEQDEQLYANEIVKLNKEAKEVLDFKSLGGDY